MIDSRTAPYAALLLRSTLGILFLAHAFLKIFHYTPAGTAAWFDSIGLPPALAYVTIGWELVGGTALILGLWTRGVALAMIPLLLGTILSYHGAAGFWFSNTGGGWEYPAFWSLALLTQSLLGDGAHALRPMPGRAALDNG